MVAYAARRLTMRPRQAVAISGSTGAQQRLRHGLGELKPYRYKGRPGWNPALALGKYRSRDRRARACWCGAQPGELCRTKSGRIMPRTTHSGR